MFEPISLFVLWLTRAGARITGGQSEDSDLGTYFRFLLTASKNWPQLERYVFFHSLFPLLCTKFALDATELRCHERVWEVPNVHANINTCARYVFMCASCSARTCASDWCSMPKPQLKDTGTLTLSDCGVSIPSFSPGGWGRVEVVVIVVVVGVGCRGYRRIVGCVLCQGKTVS